MYNVLRNVKCCMVLYIDLTRILRIYGATQGHNVVLCCIMIKIVVGGCLVLLKEGGEGHRRAYSRSLLFDVRRHGDQKLTERICH